MTFIISRHRYIDIWPSIAYQVFGDGAKDLVVIPGWLSNLDIFWEEPRVVRFLRGLGQVARVIIIDRRATGLSDRVAPPTLEEQMDDVIAVMDSAGSKTASLMGYSEGGCMCALFAATHPDRTNLRHITTQSGASLIFIVVMKEIRPGTVFMPHLMGPHAPSNVRFRSMLLRASSV